MTLGLRTAARGGADGRSRGASGSTRSSAGRCCARCKVRGRWCPSRSAGSRRWRRRASTACACCPAPRSQPDTILVDLINPDVELAALEADRQLAQAQAELANLDASVTNQRLAQESVVAGARLASSRGAAARRGRRGRWPRRASSPTWRWRPRATRRRRCRGASRSRRSGWRRSPRASRAQVQAQRQQLERLRAIADFRHKEVEALHVRAGVDGRAAGAAAAAGAVGGRRARVVAKVAQPDTLKAELRVPETQAKDVQLGQKATVDTRNGVVVGKVARIDPAAVSGTVKVDVALRRAAAGRRAARPVGRGHHRARAARRTCCTWGGRRSAQPERVGGAVQARRRR